MAITTLCVILCAGCSVRNGGTNSSSSSGKWLDSGALALSRPLPAPSKGAQRVELHGGQPDTALADALAAADTTDGATAIVISRRERTITALRPGASPLVLKTDGAQHLREGSFSVTQKEEGPLWYAPKEYFTSRALPVPPEGSRQRFKRAALGSRAIYLNDQTPIHSGPVWLKEIGGVRVNSSAMNELYTMIQVGTRVDIR